MFITDLSGVTLWRANSARAPLKTLVSVWEGLHGRCPMRKFQLAISCLLPWKPVQESESEDPTAKADVSRMHTETIRSEEHVLSNRRGASWTGKGRWFWMNMLYCPAAKGERFYENQLVASRAVMERDTTRGHKEFTHDHLLAAAFLREQKGFGGRPSSRSGLVNSHEYLEMFYATAVAGIAVITLLNTRWQPKDIAFALKDSGRRGTGGR